MRKGMCLLVALVLLLTACDEVAAPPTSPPPATFEQACWISYMEMERLYTVGDAKMVKKALSARLRDAANEGFGTVYVHVRANSDAYYDSAIFEPTDSTAVLLENGLDPLAFLVHSGHEYGLKVHAWVNPYRIGTKRERARSNDVFETDGRYYYNPASVEVRRLVTDGVRELVEQYDVDGVQFDDYFYPEESVREDRPASFESEAFANASGTVGQWRRANVSALMISVHAVCRANGCVFGVSPSYNIRRNAEVFYADVALWAKTVGYVDYLCPQLYVGFLHESAPFEQVLAEWSAIERDASVALIGGLARYKTGLFEDAYAGTGRTEWAEGGDILARQIEAVKEAAWDGVALYGDDAASKERDAAVVEREALAMKEVLLKNRAIPSRRTADSVL